MATERADFYIESRANKQNNLQKFLPHLKEKKTCRQLVTILRHQIRTYILFIINFPHFYMKIDYLGPSSQAAINAEAPPTKRVTK